jgi:hypothetical protein
MQGIYYVLGVACKIVTAMLPNRKVPPKCSGAGSGMRQEAAVKLLERCSQLIGCAIQPVQEEVHSDQVLLRGQRKAERGSARPSSAVRLATVPPHMRRP